MIIDNCRPADFMYPNFRPANFDPNRKLQIQQGDYLVDDVGDIIVATTTNVGPYCNDFVRSLTEPYFRAKFIGNKDDFLGFVNRVRRASAAEIRRAQSYRQQAVLPLF